MPQNSNKIASEMRKLGRSNPQLAIRIVNELILGINEQSIGLQDTITEQHSIIVASELLLSQGTIPEELRDKLLQTINNHLEENP